MYGKNILHISVFLSSNLKTIKFVLCSLVNMLLLLEAAKFYESHQLNNILYPVFILSYFAVKKVERFEE